jgi:hypothetical protein
MSLETPILDRIFELGCFYLTVVNALPSNSDNNN